MKAKSFFRPALILIFLSLPLAVFADGYTMIQPLPGLSSGVTLSDYLKGIFKLLIGVAGLLAVIMLVICGVRVMASASSSGKSAAKECITNAVLGILLALGSWLLLNTINPALLHNDFIVPQTPATQAASAPGPGSPGGPAAVTEPIPTDPGWYYRYKDSDGNTRNSARFDGSDQCLSAQREAAKFAGITIVSGPGGTQGCFEIFRSSATPSGTETATRNSLCGNDSCVANSATNVYINHGPCVGGTVAGCTNVAQLPSAAVSFLQSLPGACGCTVTITGGTETFGHVSHGPNKPIFDVRRTPQMETYVTTGRTADASFCNKSSDGSTRCFSKWLVNGWWFTNENAITGKANAEHYHVCQDGYAGGIACNKSK